MWGLALRVGSGDFVRKVRQQSEAVRSGGASAGAVTATREFRCGWVSRFRTLLRENT